MNAATRNRARVLLGIIAVLLFASGATALYFRFRNPVGGASPYRTVNGHHFITFAPEQAAYPADTRIFRLTISNRAGEDLIPEEDRRDEWVLEVKQGGVWHTLRADGHGVCWDFDPEEYGEKRSWRPENRERIRTGGLRSRSTAFGRGGTGAVPDLSVSGMGLLRPSAGTGKLPDCLPRNAAVQYAGPCRRI